uniref:Uncharacterized protein n=1 Tax=Octopus bimaculoides TaxID=37653 RepID=A0A0L8HK08_OCTBM
MQTRTHAFCNFCKSLTLFCASHPTFLILNSKITEKACAQVHTHTCTHTLLYHFLLLD